MSAYEYLDRLKYGVTAALKIPTDNLTKHSPDFIKLVDLDKNIVTKSYLPYLVHLSRSEGPNKTLIADVLHELDYGPLDKVSDVYIYPHVKKNTKDYTYMSSNRKIWITSVDPKAFRRLRKQFHVYACYYRKQDYSLLLNIIGLVRLSDVSNPKHSKVYYMVFQAPYPYRTYYQIKYMLFADDKRVLYMNVKLESSSPPSSSRLLVPISHDCQGFNEVDDKFWFNIDDNFKQIIAEHVKNDIAIMKALGFVNYTFFVAGGERDVSRGSLFLPGEVFGREKHDITGNFSLERKDTVVARHDINYDIAPPDQSVGASLLPVSIVKDDLTLM
jgi:hypothetical protein